MQGYVKYLFLCLFFFLISPHWVLSQGCCSGGSGNPIAGGVSQGVLLDKQLELSANYQYFISKKFYAGDKDTIALLNNLSNNYLYFRVAYGLSQKLTMSVEGGYFINKSETGLNPDNIDNTKKSGGIADLILFPRYTVYNKTNETKRTEITLGMGLKIPLGKYNDSTLVFVHPVTGLRSYTTSPPTIQPTNGSNDFIFYGFVFREYKRLKFRIFANGLYVRKGWNPLGEKFGNYASVGLFAGKTFFKKLSITLQLKGEWVDRMQAAPGLDILALYNIDLNSTGSKKISFVPQLSYTYKSFTLFALSDVPIYQYLNGVQIGFQHQLTAGLSYRFFPVKSIFKVSPLEKFPN
ncbi:MAG: hypothetical protein H7296_09715 [Bacteroidia bacterium]|nr:hypothetical protein [Bacteroidia bacterium]